jgi:hypothetical protein
MIAIEAASVVSGVVTGNDLILKKFNNTTMNAGNVRGPQGVKGDKGDLGEPAPVAAWTAPALLNGWVNNGAPYELAGYYLDRRIVYLKGLIRTGVLGSPAFVLPVGFRPAQLLVINTISNNAIGRVDVSADGSVTPVAPSSSAYVSLDGLSFRIA